MPLNIPNLVTWLRILLIPLFVAVLYLPQHLASDQEKNLILAIIFGVAALTDWLDGFLARILNQTSAFGAFLDPVADKLMVSVALLALVQLDRVNMVIAFIIVGREITISALREWMAKLGESKSVAVSYIGKVKTAVQMIAILLLLYDDNIVQVFNTHVIGTWLIYAAAILTLWSMGYYIKKALAPISQKA